jgi:hypothetical protein
VGKSSCPALADDVISRITVRKSSLSWFDRLPPEVQAETLDIRRRLASGQIPATATVLARAMIQTYRDRGYPVSGLRQVQRWLMQSDR